MDPEGHPIPQDITGFQFRLIGNMTIRQFAYLAGGAMGAWLFFSSPLPAILKIPIAGGCCLFGVILAFMSIHGRPADLMLTLFFKALFKPNQFTYKKASSVIPSDPALSRGVEKSNTQNGAVEKDLSTPVAQVASATINIPLPSQPQPAPTSNTISSTAPQPPSNNPATIQPHPDPLLKGEGELKQLPTTPPTQSPITQPPAPPAIPIQKIPVIPPDAVNLVAGVVEDPRGNVLQNILVEVIDSSGGPVRAFKTNQMGQFIAATPLENGMYTVNLEDPDKRHQFSILTITAKGEPLQPLEIKSMDQREQLRQSLFTTTAIPPVQKPS